MNIDFYIAEQNTGSIHTVDESNIMSYSEDPEAVSGLDYFSAESRNVKITFYEDDWLKENLFGSPTLITNTSFVEYVMKYTHNGQEKVYYINVDNVTYNQKQKTVDIIGTDLLGLMINLSKAKKDFDATLTDFAFILKEYIEILLRSETSERVIFSINLDEDFGSYDVADFSIIYPNRSIYLGEVPHITIAGGTNDNTADLNWQFIGEHYGVTTLIMVDLHYHFWLDAYNDEHEDLTVKHLRIHFDNDIDWTIHTNEHYTNHTFGNTAWTNIISYFNDLYSSKGFDGSNPISQLSYLDYILDESDLTFSGEIEFDTVQLQESEEGTGSLEATYKKFFKALFLYNNLYIYASGNNLNIARKDNFTGQGVEIDETELIEFEKSNIPIDQFKEEDIFDIVLEDNYKEFIIAYYENLFANVITEIKIVTTKTGLSLLDRIEISGNHYTVTKIKPDNDNIISEIEAWG